MARSDSKTQAAAQMIRKRILHGDHALHGIPAERPLAGELGVSRQTVRRALILLEREGILTRQENGRLTVKNDREVGITKPIIGFLKDNHASYDHEMWKDGLDVAVEGYNVILRSVSFEHYGDASIAAALSGFNGMFLLPPALEIPKWLTTMMREAACRVMVLDQDATKAGLPSLVMFPPRAVHRLLEHLLELGHKRIDCLNTQARDSIIDGRIACWDSFIKERGLEGTLHSLTEFHPIESAYQMVRNKLRMGGTFGPAVICTTAPAAIGAIRACHEAGYKAGRDISICAVNDEGIAPYLIPTLTCLRTSPRAFYLRRGLDWMLSKEDWRGPLLLQPDELDVPIFIGESTGPAPYLPVRPPLHRQDIA